VGSKRDESSAYAVRGTAKQFAKRVSESLIPSQKRDKCAYFALFLMQE
jgi:hypothetical protein